MRYSTAEVANLVQWKPTRVLALVRAGLLEPERVGRNYQFGFRDLVLLRTARSLEERGVQWPALRRSLQQLRDTLPDGQPLSALRLSAHGRRVLVDIDGVLFEPQTGQTQLRFERTDASDARAVTLTPQRNSAAQRQSDDVETLYERALEHEDDEQFDAAIVSYRACLSLQPEHAAANLNLGRLLQSRSEFDAARACYESARKHPETSALAWFNLGTLEEDCNNPQPALDAYHQAANQGVIDAHYNLARLYEHIGERDAALQQLLRFNRAEKR